MSGSDKSKVRGNSLTASTATYHVQRNGTKVDEHPTKSAALADAKTRADSTGVVHHVVRMDSAGRSGKWDHHGNVVASVSQDEPGTHRYNLAMDFIIAGFRNFHEAKAAKAAGNLEGSKELKTKAMRFLLSAMETPGCAELVYSFNRINTSAALPEELDDDEGIDPASFSELDLSDFDDDDDDEDDSDDDDQDDDDSHDDADDADLGGGSEDSSTSDTVQASADPKLAKWHFQLKDGSWGYVDAESKEHAQVKVKQEHGKVPVHIERAAISDDEQTKLAMANMLSLTGEPSHKRMALQLLKPESAK